jgi:tetratricopeptide (TPR) repeat protein
MGKVTIVRRSGGYILVADATETTLDLERFRDLCARGRGDELKAVRSFTEALSLWRGEALTGLDGEWVRAERERLEQERLAAEHDLVDARLRAGDGRELVAELSARAVRHPLDERVAGQYLLVLHRSGRTTDALEYYRQLRARLVEEMGADPGAALQELHRQILTADPRLLAAPTSTALVTAPAEPMRPRQLPAAPGPFVGRQDELHRLGTLTPGTVTVIAGAGGIGKTWLALHWAHRHVDRFPDGQLFVDLRGFSPDATPMDPAVALRGFLDALGVNTAALPGDPHAQAALLRSLVADRRMLLVLDNAGPYTAQVTPLLPGGAACAVVVTSRQHLPGLITGHGARHLAVDVLPEDEAMALLTERLGADVDPGPVHELVTLCGGYPLALGIVASLARTRSHVPLAALADELRDSGLSALDDDDPAASLPTVLSWSRHALTPDQDRLFVLLALGPGADIGLHAAASLAGLPPPRTATLLRGLERASLITRTADGRYAVHDLVSAYAASAGPPDGAALRRVLDFYLHTAHHADRLMDDAHRTPVHLAPPSLGTHVEPLPDARSAMAWFDREHPTLLAAQYAATRHGAHDIAWSLAPALNRFLHRRGHRAERLAVWRAAAEAAIHLSDHARLLALRHLGSACATVGLRDEAFEHLTHAIRLAEQHDDPDQQGHAHQALARLLGRTDQRLALQHTTRALTLFLGLDKPLCQAHGHNAVAWYTAQLGDHDTARHHLHAALLLHRDHPNPTGEANTLDSLGYVEHATGNHHRAIDLYRQALTLRRAAGNAHDSASTLHHLGHPLAALGHHTEAREAWQGARELYRQQGRNREALQVHHQLLSLRGPQ